MTGTQIKDFTKGSIPKQLLRFAFPLFLANLLQVVYSMVDMVVVGNTIGNAGISAVAVGGDVATFMTFIAMGFSNAGQVIIAKYIGAGKKDKIGRFVGTMGFFLFLCAVVVSALAFIFRVQILDLMNTPAEAYEGAMSYAVISMAGLIFVYGYNAVSAILRGMGDSKHPFIFIAIAAVLNLILDLVFVVGFDMGAGGAALATIISQAVSFVSCTVFLVIRRADFALNITGKDFVSPDRSMLSALVKLGVPMAIKSASIQFSKLFVNSWINGYGVAVSAFSGIANKIANITNMISLAIGTASATMVGQNIASHQHKRVKQIMLNVAVISLTVSVIFSVVFCLFPEQIFSLFTDGNDAEIFAILSGYIPIAVLLFFGSGARTIMNGILNGSGDYKVNFVTAILDGIILRIGLAILFGIVLDMKHYGFWLGDALAGFTPFWIGLVYYFSGRWKRQDI
ncbi:MAG: MATE family efflux transporter [Clostridia bacterium]|nr:MATE family efflux transporter [Clostridia bacterium]